MLIPLISSVCLLCHGQCSCVYVFAIDKNTVFATVLPSVSDSFVPVCWPQVSVSGLHFRTLPWLTMDINTISVRCPKLLRVPPAAEAGCSTAPGGTVGYNGQQWTPACVLVVKRQTTSFFFLGGPQGGSKPSSRAVLAQKTDPMQSVALTPFPFWCLLCRVLLENSISCTPKVGCAMLPLPGVKRPITCCLLLLESPVHGIKHRLI